MTRSHEPDEKTRSIVETMAGFGVPENDIARAIGVDPKTLRKHYREELDTAFIKANVRVAQSLFRMATEGNVAAAIFWMKARANWTERSIQDVNVYVHDGARDKLRSKLDRLTVAKPAQEASGKPH